MDWELFLYQSFDPLESEAHLGNDIADAVHGLRICHGVTNANGEAVLQQPVVDEVLSLGQEGAGGLGPLFHPDHMNERPSTGTQCLFAQRSSQQLPVLYQHLPPMDHIIVHP